MVSQVAVSLGESGEQSVTFGKQSCFFGFVVFASLLTVTEDVAGASAFGSAFGGSTAGSAAFSATTTAAGSAAATTGVEASCSTSVFIACFSSLLIFPISLSEVSHYALSQDNEGSGFSIESPICGHGGEES